MKNFYPLAFVLFVSCSNSQEDKSSKPIVIIDETAKQINTGNVPKGRSAENTTRYDNLINEGLNDLQQNKLTEAIKVFNDAIAIDNSRVEGYYGLGVAKSGFCFTEDKLCSEAIVDLNKAVSINPKYRRAFYNLSVCKNKLGDFNGALAALNKAIELDPNDADYYHNRGLAKIQLGDKTGACEDFYKSVQLGSELSKKLIDINCK